MRKLFAGDCLDVLSDGSRIDDESVDLIYLDPPFNSQSTYNLPFSKQMIKEQDLKPVMAFEDTWTWSDNEVEQLAKLKEGDYTDTILAQIVDLVRNVYREMRIKNSMAAYLINMALRLKAMKRVLKPTGSIYLHCDTTAGHYLKMLMDAMYGHKNFIGEVVWNKQNGVKSRTSWGNEHDSIFAYVKKKGGHAFNVKDPSCRIPFAKTSLSMHFTNQDEDGRYYRRRTINGKDYIYYADEGRFIGNLWNDVPSMVANTPLMSESLGYPTQKPIALLERIVKVSSNEGDLVLDPFCGCGTTVHVANDLSREWIGIDVSKFSVGLIRNRILQHFQELRASDIQVLGSVVTLQDALDLAKVDKFEFEKWACGEIGAEGMYHDPGQRGADGGVDGIIPFQHSEQLLQDTEATYAIVQVKGGNVSVNDVKALSTTVRERKGKCGVFVCFDRYMNTVNNQREKGMIKDATGNFPFIQGFSVEQIINGERPDLPCFPRAA